MADGFDIPIKTTEAEKAIASLLKQLQDFGSKADKSLGDFSKSQKSAFDKLGDSAKNIETKLGSVGSVIKGLGVAAAAVVSINALTHAFEGAIHAAREKEDALNAVQFALQRTGQYSDAAFQQVRDFADELERTTGVADDVTLKLFSMATSFTSNKEQAEKLVHAATELSAVTGKSLEQSVTALGKSLAGIPGPLDDMDIGLRGLTPDALKAGAAIDAVLKNFGGSAEAQMNTFSGAIKSVGNAFDDVQTSIGNLITQNPAIISLLKGLGDAFGELEKLVNTNKDGIKNFIATFAIGFAKQIPPLLYALDALIGGFDVLLSKGDSITGFFDGTADAIGSVVDELLLLTRGFTELKLLSKAPIDVLRADDLKELREMRPELAGLINQLEEIDKRRDANAAALGRLTQGVVPAVGAPNPANETGIVKIANALTDAILKAEKQLAAGNVAQPVEIKNTPKTAAAAAGPLENLPGFNIQPLLDRVQTAFDSISSSFLSNISGGKEGARKFVGELGGSLATLFGASGPVAAGITSAIQFLGQDPETFKKAVDGFVKGVPEIIANIVENIPVIIQALADHSGEIITALVSSAPRIIVALSDPKLWINVANALATQISEGVNYQLGKFQLGADSFFDGVQAAGTAFGDYIGTAVPQKIEAGLNGVVETTKSGFSDFFQGFDFLSPFENAGAAFSNIIADSATQFYNGVVDAVNAFIDGLSGGANDIGGKGQGIIPDNVPILGGLATGGTVPTGFPGDSFGPLGLTSNEVVIPSNDVDALRSFLADPGAGSRADSQAMTALLAQILVALNQPMNVESSVELDSSAFADIVLRLNRQNQRLTA